MHRRSVLTGAGAAGLAALGLGSVATSAQTLRLRKPVSSLPANDPDLAALRRAIPLMRRSGAWDRQIALHADMNQRHHNSWRFLPWHRLQLVWFERIVADLSGRAAFALPYWDWDDDRVPDLIFTDDAFRLAGREVRQGESIQAYMRANGRTYTGRITDDFATFFGRPRNARPSGQRGYSGSAEWSGHNMLHGFVGGDMGRLDRSPNDPLFWMHHANIDRIWSLWHQRNSDQIYPKSWRDEAFTGFVDARGRLAPTATAASTLTTAGFGYDYAFDPTPPIVFATAPRAVLRQATLAWAAQMLGPTRAVLDIPAADIDNGRATATGYLDLRPDPAAGSVVRLRATAADGSDILQEAIFLVPSGACEAQQGHRIRLDGLWTGRDTGGLRIEIEAAPLAGRGGAATATALLGFVLDAEVTYFE
ncbi:MAG: hypothetical protein GC145_08820 [Caulobacter sp.]|nr:hypothetical protein [Caulobacter sp.]